MDSKVVDSLVVGNHIAVDMGYIHMAVVGMDYNQVVVQQLCLVVAWVLIQLQLLLLLLL